MANNLSRFRDWTKRLVQTLSGPQRTEITVQTDQLFIIRKRRFRRRWCEACGRDVDAVELREAEKLAGTTRYALPGNAGSEAWHVCAGEHVCLESVLKSLGRDGEIRRKITGG